MRAISAVPNFASTADWSAWNETMFRRYGNDRLYFHPNPFIRHIQNRRIRTLLRFLDLKTSDSFLDVGSGEGFLLSVAGLSRMAVGLDLSSAALRIARSRSRMAAWIRADAHRLPFAAGSFDKICCSEVLEHLPSPNEALAELHRVVRRNGRVVITVPCEAAINQIKDWVLPNPLGRRLFANIPLRTEWHLTDYSPGLLRSQVRDLFRIVQEKMLPHRWLRIGYALVCQPRS